MGPVFTTVSNRNLPSGGVASRVDAEWVKNVYQGLGDASVKRFGRYVLENDVVALSLLRECGGVRTSGFWRVKVTLL